jgi:glycosyltransferase involved in cell wall biosynthesis
MKPIKQIIIAHYTLPPVIGGVESILKSQAEVFAQHGYYVTLLAGEGNIEGQNIKTSLIPDLSPNNPHSQAAERIFRLGSLPENYELRLTNLQKKIETEVGNINTIIIHNIMSMPFNLTATEAFWNYIEKNPDKKYYLWIHDLAWLMDEHKKQLYNRRPWTLLKSALPQVRYITVSEYRRRQAAELLNIPRKKIFLNFHDETTRVISHLSLFHKYPLILIPARQIPRKNIERSIQIIAILKSTFPEILGIVTGPPKRENGQLTAYSQHLQDLVNDHELTENVIFLDDVFSELGIPPQKNRNVVHDLYFVAHLVLYLSLDEGFGLPILEAGASRTPIAVSQLPVFREIANDGVFYLPADESPEFNANRLAKFLQKNLSHSDILFKQVLSRYNWETYWQDYLKILFEE